MTRLCGLTVGDPRNPKHFSGSARQLFAAIERAGALTNIYNVEPSKFARVAERSLVIASTRRVPGTQLIAEWSDRAVGRRSRRAHAFLESDENAAGALLYGTNFFPAPAGLRARVPVGAALDATFAQLARSGESWFGKLAPADVDHCIDRQKRVLDRCEWLFPRSEWCARSLADDYNIPKERICITGAGPNFDEMPPPRKSYDCKTILFVGRDWNRKNGPLVLDALNLARKVRPDLRLQIVGPDSTPGARDGVEWIGPLERGRRAELLILYSQASLLAFPSRFEPFGIAMLEAMAAGCPVIAMNQWAAPEVIQDGISGTLLKNPEPRALAEAMLWWLSNAERLAAAGDAARTRVREYYNWDHAARRILDAFTGRAGAPRGWRARGQSDSDARLASAGV
ncbi:MAG: glycosyltransferase family 4 protein [Planctomycetes bacterium]|nr:glycosyltransferase family 4 protein [Planctomycetota bacterium]